MTSYASLSKCIAQSGEKEIFRDVDGDGGALCPVEALHSLIARLDVSCYNTSENVLSNYSY